MQSQDEPKWGEPPLGEVIARLMAERYPLTPGEALVVDVDTDKKSLALTLRARRHQDGISVQYLRGAGPQRDPWMLMVDALDALYGTFIEAGRSHRQLPIGADVIFSGAAFVVTTEHRVPEIEKLADQLLGDDVNPRGS